MIRRKDGFFVWPPSHKIADVFEFDLDPFQVPFPKPSKMKFAAALVLLSASASAWTADKASSRRNVLNKVAGAAAVVAAPGVAGAYSVPDLQYGFDALEPFM